MAGFADKEKNFSQEPLLRDVRDHHRRDPEKNNREKDDRILLPRLGNFSSGIEED